jgi:hypothetical protein
MNGRSFEKPFASLASEGYISFTIKKASENQKSCKIIVAPFANAS